MGLSAFLCKWSSAGCSVESRQRGFKWSQATVWAVEKGERPLRLAEADALGGVLGVQYTLLLSSEKRVDLVYEMRKFTALLDEIEDLTYRSFERQRLLVTQIDWHRDEWPDDPEAKEVLRRNGVDAAVDGLARAEAAYRSQRELNQPCDPVSSARSDDLYASAFMESVARRLAAERTRLPGQMQSGASDGIDQTA